MKRAKLLKEDKGDYTFINIAKFFYHITFLKGEDRGEELSRVS